MARLKEPLNGGLHTGGDPADLDPGQLSYIQNGVYKPASEALYRARGRTAWAVCSGMDATPSAVDVVGLRDAHFDNGDHYLIAHGVTGTSANHYYLPITAAAPTVAASASILASGVGIGSQLECVQYRNRFYLFNGTSANVTTKKSPSRVVYLSATAAGTAPMVRSHGLLPVTAYPHITTAVGSFSQTVTGYYEYWTTEAVRYQQDGVESWVESTFGGASGSAPGSVAVLNLTTVPTVEMPLLANPEATHWKIYRSPVLEGPKERSFPAGWLVETLPITATAWADSGGSTTTTWALPQGFVVPSDSGFYGGPSWATWAGATNLSVSGDGNYAAGSGFVGGAFANPVQQVCSGFAGLAGLGINGSIRGIEVEVGAMVSAGSCPLSVYLVSLNRAFGWTKSNTVTSVAATGKYTYGSPTDVWVPSQYGQWTADDFGPYMGVVLSMSTVGQKVSADYVQMRVTYGGVKDGDTVVQFPTVAYTFGDAELQVGKNGPPPAASTGDIYQETLVCNDVNRPKTLCYSAPEDPDAFPGTYYINFETQDNDIIRCVRVVNARLVVGLDTSIWRVNYLPSERDASFDRGKAIEPISRAFGIVNPMCAATFSPDGTSELLGFVSWKGVHFTDGFSVTTLTNELDWDQILSRTSISAPIALINDPENLELVFYYRNDSYTTDTYRALHFSYAPRHVGLQGNIASHQAGGVLKVSGPVYMRNWTTVATVTAYGDLKSAWPVPRVNGDTTVHLGYGGAASATAAGCGKIYRETGSSIPCYDQALKFSTRRMFLAGEGQEFKMNEVYTYCANLTTGAASGQVIKVTPDIIKTNDGAGVSGVVTQGPYYATAVGKLFKHQVWQAAEGMRLTWEVTATGAATHADVAPNWLILDGADFGLEDSGA